MRFCFHLCYHFIQSSNHFNFTCQSQTRNHWRWHCILGSQFLYHHIIFFTKSKSFEISSITIKLLHSKLTVFNIYRNHYLPNTSKKSTPSKSSHDPVSFSESLADLHILIATAATTPHDFIITGDFNLHIDNIYDPRTQQFMSLLENSNLTQHVSFPTHQHGHILDLGTNFCYQFI